MKSLVTPTQKGLGPIICSAPNHRSESTIAADNKRYPQLNSKCSTNVLIGVVKYWEEPFG